MALAVIFLPWLLDGAGVGRGERVAPPPEPSPETRAFLDGGELAPLAGPGPGAEPAVPRPAPAPSPAPGAASPRWEELAPLAPSAAAGTRPAAAGPGATAGAPVSHAVQVGSFEREAAALALRDRLRREGFAAYVEPARQRGGILYRVRVGPVAGLEEARDLQQRLQAATGGRTLIVRHPGDGDGENE